MTTPADGLELMLFTARPERARAAIEAGISTFVIDWETRGKDERQRGADLETNANTPEQLRAMAEVGGSRRVCRINGLYEQTGREVDTAVGCGATDILLPMVRSPHEVETFLRLIDGRCRAGILLETAEACGCARELARLPLDLVYVGLNDLALSRGRTCIFDALVDGTVPALRDAFPETPFGLAGATVLDGGDPLPCLRLLEEMARLRCAFTFLRRSYRREVAGRHEPAEVARIQGAWRRLRDRTQDECERDRHRLCEEVDRARTLMSVRPVAPVEGSG